MVALETIVPYYNLLVDRARGDAQSNQTAATTTALAAAATAASASGGRGSTSTTTAVEGARGGQTTNGRGGGNNSQKRLQHQRSQKYSEYYVEIILAFVGLLVVRNVVLMISRAYNRRQRRKADSAAVEKGSAPQPFKHSALERGIYAVDRAALQPFPFLPSDWSYLRVGLIVVNIALSVIFCLVNVFNGTGTAKLFADRAGRISTADLPLLFLFSLRFWHIYLGSHSTVLAIIHTFAYIGNYYANNNVARLQSAYAKLYFKMGIVAVVFMFAISATGFGFIRRRGYQAFLALHVAGAGIILAGCWYHRPNMQDWVMGTVGIWVFERLWRICSVFTSFANMRFFVRAPIIRAKATIVDGAIKLDVPCKGRMWAPGQHFYISFWYVLAFVGRDLLRRPHLYGQTHPFCVANVPRADSEAQEMRFVLRIYKGITSELEQHIRRKVKAKGGEEVEMMVAVEGPFDNAEPAEKYDSVLCLAGGSGITHPLSVLADVCQKAMQGKAATTNVRLVWAIHHAEQVGWVEETLDEARAWAAQANLSLSIDLYITRQHNAVPTLSSSGTATPTTESASFDEEKKVDLSSSPAGSSDALGLAAVAKCNRFSGRPDVAVEVSKMVCESTGRTLVVACGPIQLAEDVRRAVKEYKPSQLNYEIAKFDCPNERADDERLELDSPPSPPPHPSSPTPPPILEGFREDDGADFGDLLKPSSTGFGASSTYSAFGGPQDDDDLAANPFADLASSSAQLPYDDAPAQSPFYTEPTEPSPPVQSAYDEPAYAPPEEPAYVPVEQPPVSAYEHDTSAFEPSTPVTSTSVFPERHFEREAAPEPETPAQPHLQPGDPAGFSYSYQRPTPSTSRFLPPSSSAAHAPPQEESPFASQSQRRGKADLSALLGDEKPATLSGFRRGERAEGTAGPLGSKIAVLPAKSVGKTPVARPLAALLGLETEEEEPKASAKNASPPAPPPAQSAEPPAPVEAAPFPPEESTPQPLSPSALETPLPPSRAETPTQAAPSSAKKEDNKPALSRAISTAPSSLSVDDSRYDSMVSPLDTGLTPSVDGKAADGEAWPANKAVDALDEQLTALKVDEPAAPPPAEPETTSAPPSASYSQYIFGEGTSTPASAVESVETSRRPSYETPTSRGFRAFNASSDDGGGFGATDDADSLRGTYSRSVEVGDGDDAETETGVSTPGTERTVAMGEPQRTEREGSAPLPPLPAQSPTIQGSPRSTQLGGSLGPTFVITVGDPQTVGSALNPAAQHTVYTVRTRTTSSAYRKPDFAVLRRFSHFLWLYDALTQNNPGVIVPGMPEKHAIGRFGTEFVENRRLGLESALNKIVSHPMLVGDPDLRLFLESDTFHIDIKQRKLDTTAENKGFLANLSSSISGPKFTEFDDYFDQRRQQLDAFETQLRSLLDSLGKAAKARHGLQGSIAELQSAFLALAQCDLSSSLRSLLDEAAAVQKKLFDLAEAQAAQEEKIDGLTTVAESYARLCTSARGVFGARIKAYHTWQAAEANLRKMQAAHEKAKRSGRTHSELLNLSVAEIADNGSLRLVFGNQAERKMLDARHDFDDVSKLTKAEMARFDKEKVDDFKKALEDYADSLAARQREVVETWQQYHDLLAKAVEANKAAASASHAGEAASTTA
ncbi:Vacuolar protein sorting-associated protein vps5 [Rhodotorula kratochvilovae]